MHTIVDNMMQRGKNLDDGGEAFPQGINTMARQDVWIA